MARLGRPAAWAALLLGSCAATPGAGEPSRPNILWIIVEDASPNLSCYGETVIRTPNLDALARDGVRFENAFTTCPVCSPSRSALITGMVQTTLGAHQHRSQHIGRKASGNTAYYDSYRVPVPLVPELFRKAGYFVSIQGKDEQGDHARLGGKPSGVLLAKTDYNFMWDTAVYEATDWKECPADRPFFAQIMLRGGQNRRAREHATDPAKVKLPPYDPDHPVIRRDRADYLNSWVQADREAAEILEALESSGRAKDTIVFFLSDHGRPHVRGIQFLYDDGMRIPLIVRFPDGRRKGTVREDLVRHIDVAATSLALAGLPLPDAMQGDDLFAKDYRPRDRVFSARDRCDETVDLMRSVRTHRYKYIRNFLPHLPHAQPNQYKDGYRTLRLLRELHEKGRLDPLQARIFRPVRPVEELYDLERDPLETVNLAGRPGVRVTQDRLRRALYDWMVRSGDLGLIPEPILEDLGKKYGNKFFVLRQPENRGLVRRLIDVIEAGDRKDRARLLEALASPRPSIRYWAATGLGTSGDPAAVDPLLPRLEDPSPAVRVAAALALGRLGRSGAPERVLAREIRNENVIVGMYAVRALEWIGDGARRVRADIAAARDSRYEFIRRIARRITAKFAE